MIGVLCVFDIPINQESYPAFQHSEYGQPSEAERCSGPFPSAFFRCCGHPVAAWALGSQNVTTCGHQRALSRSEAIMSVRRYYTFPGTLVAVLLLLGTPELALAQGVGMTALKRDYRRPPLRPVENQALADL